MKPPKIVNHLARKKKPVKIMSDAVEKRKLSELRVVDLKQELEKRGKDGNGVKNVLIERLTQVSKDG